MRRFFCWNFWKEKCRKSTQGALESETNFDLTRQSDESHRQAAKLAPHAFAFSHQGYIYVQNFVFEDDAFVNGDF